MRDQAPPQSRGFYVRAVPRKQPDLEKFVKALIAVAEQQLEQERKAKQHKRRSGPKVA